MAIRLTPDLAAAHNNLGNALHAQGKLVEAVAEFRTAIRIEPDHAEPHLNLGLALKAQGNLAEAIAELRKAGHYAQRGSELAQLIERALSESER
jgi:tetratricopeptide (TPR) repeat protein